MPIIKHGKCCEQIKDIKKQNTISVVTKRIAVRQCVFKT